MAEEAKASTTPVVVVTFEDGTVEEVRLNPKVMVLAERHFGGRVPPIEGTLWTAWQRLGRPGGKFDDWLDTVEDVNERDVEVRPTKAAAGAGS